MKQNIKYLNNYKIEGGVLKKLYSIILVLMFSISTIHAQGTAPVDSDGDGKLEIINKQHLLYLSDNPNADLSADYEQVDDIYFQGSDFESGGDFYNDGKGFRPIGADTNPGLSTFTGTKFTGSYDGQGHFIRGVIINRGAQYYIGFFGYFEGATVKNLGLENLDISGNMRTAGLVAYCKGTVTNCYTTGSISSTDKNIGGLIGQSHSTATVSKSYSTANVTGNNNVAGLIGSNWGSISNCYSTGAVSGQTDIGGLVGYNDGSISNCYSCGSVTGSVRSGLVGFQPNSNSGGTTNSFWDTESSGQDNSDSGTGKTTAEMQSKSTYTNAGWDFLGETANGTNGIWRIDEGNDYPKLVFIKGEGTASHPFQITNLTDLNWLSDDPEYWSYEFVQTADIDVSVTQYWESWDGDGFIAVGNNGTEFTGKYNGQFHIIDNLYSNRPNKDYVAFFGSTNGATIENIGITNANVTGDGDVGSLAGIIANTTVRNCFSTGNVAGKGYAIGGLIGMNSHGSTISRSFSRATVNALSSGISVGGLTGSNSGGISKCFSHGNVSNGSTLGGLVGSNNVAGSIYNSYSIGAVSGSGDEIGGLVGNNLSTVSNSFWNTETSGEPASAGGTGKTAAEMQALPLYTNLDTEGLSQAWDFINDPYNDGNSNDHWGMNNSDNNGYPFLDWQNHSSSYDLPAVSSQAVTDILANSATGNGNISDLGNPANIKQYGVCWSTSTNPDTLDNHSDEGSISSTGSYTTTITGLTEGTEYYVRTYVINDGGYDYGSQVSFTTNIRPTGSNESITLDEDNSYTFKSEDFTYSDSDSDPFSGIKITSLETAGDLEYNGTDISINDEINDLSKLIFIPEPDSNGSGYATFEFKVYDSKDYSSTSYTMIINVDPVNDAPTGGDDDVTTNEDENYTFQDSDFTFIDTDGDNFSGIKIISKPAKGNLEYNDNNVLINDVISDVSDLVFIPGHNANGIDYASFKFKVYDGTDYSSSDYTMTIDVEPINDVPSFIKGDDQTIAEDAGPQEVTGWSSSISPGPDNESSQTLDFNISNDNNSLFSKQPTIVSSTGDLSYTPAPDSNGIALVTISLSDDGGTNNGGQDTSPKKTFTITINSVNDLPTGGDGEVTTGERLAYTFKTDDFIYHDIETPEIPAIKIISTTTTGDLEYDSSDVGSKMECSNISKLIFTPPPAENGTPLTNFTFRVKDSSGAYSDSIYTMNINVSEIEYPPEIANSLPDITVREDAEETRIDLANVFTDSDNNDNRIQKNVFFNSDTSLVLTSIIDNTLNLNYKAHQFGTANIIIKGTSNSKTVNDTFHVEVKSVNDPPIGHNDAITLDENTTYNFQPEDFTYSDIEGHKFDGIKITTLETAGQLTCFGKDVTLGSHYYPDVSKIKFTPEKDSTGNPYASFKFKLRDKAGAFSDSAYRMTINVANIDKPLSVTNPISDLTVHEDAVVSKIDLEPVFTDPDDEIINKTILNNSDSSLIIASILADTLRLDYQSDQYGNCELIIKAESNNYTVTDSFMVRVKPVNDAPYSSNDTLTIKEEESYSFSETDFIYNDVEDDSMAGIKFVELSTKGELKYEVGNVKLGRDYTDLTKIVFTPLANEIGSPYTEFEFKIKDSKGAYSDSVYTMEIYVTEVNDPPLFTTYFPDTIIAENQILKWDYNAVDPDSDTLIYGISEIAKYYNDNWVKTSNFVGVIADSSNGQIFFKPNYDQAGKYRVIFYVTDGQAVVSDTTNILINNVNRRPEFIKIIPDTTVTNDVDFIFEYVARDPDEDRLLFGLQDTTDGLILTESGQLTWKIPEQPKNEYKIKIYVTDKIDTVVTTAVIEVEDVVSIGRIGLCIPDEYSLGHNYPNPFNPTTTITYGLPEKAKVKISIYNIKGKLIETVLNSHKEAGYHKIIWNANDVSTGVYIYRIQTESYTDVKKCILMK